MSMEKDREREIEKMAVRDDCYESFFFSCKMVFISDEFQKFSNFAWPISFSFFFSQDAIVLM